MTFDKICINCLGPVKARAHERPDSYEYRKRLYCSQSCSLRMRRRMRNRKPHPPEVQAEIERRVAAGRTDVPSGNDAASSRMVFP